MTKKLDQYDPSRRRFLKNMFLGGAGAVAAGTLGKLAWNFFNDKDDNQSKPKDTVEHKVNSIRDKPIDLGYQEIVADKDVAFVNSTGGMFSTLSRISRCLRRKPVTDAVEDRYNIPRGLLMAMMAQEGMGDPTMPNLPRGKHIYGDGGLGLIHIQAVNAHKFGLNTLPRYTNEYCDDKHAKNIVDTLKSCNYNMPKLVEYDDRFHPVMAIDCAARFLIDCKTRKGQGTDDRIHALAGYSGRPYSNIVTNRKGERQERGYGLLIIKYRSIINDITGDGFPQNFSKNIYNDIAGAKKTNSSIKQSLKNIKCTIDGKEASYEEYLAYFEESVQNFELEKYVALGAYKTSKVKTIDTPKEESDKRGEKIKNTMILSEFVDTKQHNSQGFLLYRYKVKEGDILTTISNKFDERDKQNGDQYKNTGKLNIIKRNGKTADNIKKGDIVYIKVRETTK